MSISYLLGSRHILKEKKSPFLLKMMENLLGMILKPGYGLKSIYDKLDILFPDKYEVALYNRSCKTNKDTN